MNEVSSQNPCLTCQSDMTLCRGNCEERQNWNEYWNGIYRKNQIKCAITYGQWDKILSEVKKLQNRIKELEHENEELKNQIKKEKEQ